VSAATIFFKVGKSNDWLEGIYLAVQIGFRHSNTKEVYHALILISWQMPTLPRADKDPRLAMDRGFTAARPDDVTGSRGTNGLCPSHFTLALCAREV
jgi:hypothetical protein